ncbi:isoaspartyl peptidase/L-asparaginase family protein [Candidatus Thiosymbion oneisti]|nr:isoaspartyl peptidase/L-asparaginase [Candidatus Thiosymbion oneisti]
MKYLPILIVIFSLWSNQLYAECNQQKEFTLMIHGGSGSGDKHKETQEKMLKVIQKALAEGHDLLKNGAKGEDVVVKVISILEDSPLFNAGRGGNKNKAGFIELDASIMRGDDKNCGAVAAVKRVKNPIKAAQKVMNASKHVMFAGDAADAFAEKQGLETVPNSYFYSSKATPSAKDIGTVGAVVRDRCGTWSAGTSTGGFGTKAPGRIGDSPIIGAGTYAENNICAVSCTGHGEFFIRYAAAHSICSLIKYKAMDGKAAASKILSEELLPAGGKGGIIVIDKIGKGHFHFTTKGMSWGRVTEDGKPEVGI